MKKPEGTIDPHRPAASVVVEWLLTGATEAQVAEALAAKYPHADGALVLSKVRKYLADCGRPDVDAVRGWALLSYRKLYQEMLKVGDYNGARQVVRQITALMPQ